MFASVFYLRKKKLPLHRHGWCGRQRKHCRSWGSVYYVHSIDLCSQQSALPHLATVNGTKLDLSQSTASMYNSCSWLVLGPFSPSYIQVYVHYYYYHPALVPYAGTLPSFDSYAVQCLWLAESVVLHGNARVHLTQ